MDATFDRMQAAYDAMEPDWTEEGEMEDDRHICTECGLERQYHALDIRDDGVVVAGAYTDDTTFTICADRRAQRDTAHQDCSSRIRATWSGPFTADD